MGADARQPQLIPKPPRRMKQPRKDPLRLTIRCRDAEIYRLRAEIALLRRPWWKRLAHALGMWRITRTR